MNFRTFTWQKRLIHMATAYFIGKTAYMCFTDLIFLNALEDEIIREHRILQDKETQIYHQVLNKPKS